MTHARARKRLSDHLERSLSSAERREVDAHLAECQSCADELRELERTVSLLRRLPDPEPPPHLSRKVMARLAGGEGRRAGLGEWLQQLTQPVLAVPMAAALVALALFFAPQDPRLEPGTAPTELARAADPSTPAGTRRDAEPGLRAKASPELRLFRSQGLSWAQHHALRGRTHEVARRLRGAGHPHSELLAAHFEGSDDFAPVGLELR